MDSILQLSEIGKIKGSRGAESRDWTIRTETKMKIQSEGIQSNFSLKTFVLFSCDTLIFWKFIVNGCCLFFQLWILHSCFFLEIILEFSKLIFDQMEGIKTVQHFSLVISKILLHLLKVHLLLLLTLMNKWAVRLLNS